MTTALMEACMENVGFTEQQRLVIEARLRGEKLEAIASELGIAMESVATHERRGWAKLGYEPPRRLRSGQKRRRQL